MDKFEEAGIAITEEELMEYEYKIAVSGERITVNFAIRDGYSDFQGHEVWTIDHIPTGRKCGESLSRKGAAAKIHFLEKVLTDVRSSNFDRVKMPDEHLRAWEEMNKDDYFSANLCVGCGGKVRKG